MAGSNDLWPLVGSRMAASESSVRTDEHVNWQTRGCLAVMQAAILAASIALGLGSIVGLGFSLFGGWPLWASLTLLFACIGSLVALALLIQNMVHELSGHYWRQSPAEQALMPALVDLLESMAHREREGDVPRIIPYQVNGETRATSAAPANPVELDRADARMLDFLMIAMTRHIDAPTRRKMRADDGMKHFTLSQCKEPLNREVYDAIIVDLMAWGFVAERKGIGRTWAMPPADAYRVLAAEVERRRTG